MICHACKDAADTDSPEKHCRKHSEHCTCQCRTD
mgnify:CR=1 FL=1